jgi:hypothetical protein
MSSFVRWVLQFKNDDSAIGDVARDMMVDMDLKKTWCYRTVIKHLDQRGACDSVYTILAEANQRYRMMVSAT